jgi:hypothetical protein
MSLIKLFTLLRASLTTTHFEKIPYVQKCAIFHLAVRNYNCNTLVLYLRWSCNVIYFSSECTRPKPSR